MISVLGKRLTVVEKRGLRNFHKISCLWAETCFYYDNGAFTKTPSPLIICVSLRFSTKSINFFEDPSNLLIVLRGYIGDYDNILFLGDFNSEF